MKKALFLTNIPVPYRMDFFNELGKYVDLTVVFERTHAKTREDSWLESECKNFQGIFMKGIPVGDDCAFCPEIISMEKFCLLKIRSRCTFREDLLMVT